MRIILAYFTCNDKWHADKPIPQVNRILDWFVTLNMEWISTTQPVPCSNSKGGGAIYSASD